MVLSSLLWVPEVQVSNRPAKDAHPPLRRLTQLALSPLAESLALIHGLEWCHSHLKTSHFQSALFLTDYQLDLALLSTAPAFLQPKSFWDIWDLFDPLSSRVALNFQ